MYCYEIYKLNNQKITLLCAVSMSCYNRFKNISFRFNFKAIAPVK